MSSSPSPILRSGKPQFEATDILDFDFPLLPIPPKSNDAGTGSIPDDEDEGMDLDAELAMMEAEQEEEQATLRIARIQREMTAESSPGLPQGNQASSSRIPLTPSPEPEFDPLDILQPIPMRNYLPPLQAESASGRIIIFKRRSRLRPPIYLEESREVLGVKTSGLLGQPLHHLMAEVEELKSLEKALQFQIQYDTERRHHQKMSSSSTAPATTMWVDKYRPKKFSDLLGEDRVHREVMGWLKEWDRCVFKRVAPGKKRKLDPVEGENIYVDHLGRPKDRILLLSGPPGYGKTTLAHIVARQAGYRTLEINASDDRSTATVTTRIKNAIESGSGLASEGKPTCVVIDEVDGAGGGGDGSFIRSLIKLIQDVPARKKTNTPAKPLRRPIICICNDLYATALRPLRPFARIIRFRKPQAQFLVTRLREICERESLTADLRVLTSLVELTSGDVRSCLNTLQFIKSRSSVVSEEAIKSTSIGLKDTTSTLQTVWSALFVPLAAKTRQTLSRGSTDTSKTHARLLPLLSSVTGDMDKVVQGCFEHYPNLKPIDASMGNVCKMMDWLGYYDRLSGRIGENMDFELMGYLGYAVVPWYNHFAAPANSTKPTEWPKADYECFQTRLVNEEVATSFKSGVPPALRCLFSPTTTLTELIPFMMRIIAPPLKPVNANIVKPAEKVVLGRLVELLIPLGLTFFEEKGENEQPMMRLEPPVDVFIHYEGKRAEDIATSRFAVRQLVAQAMDAELARRKGATSTQGSGAESLKAAYGVAKRGRAEAELAVKEVVATDFFGRTKSMAAIFTPPVGDDDESLPVKIVEEQPAKRFRAVYKFHEGSSSAVRKSIKMSALM